MKVGKILICVMLFFSMTFLSVGYANFTSSLAINGSLTAERVGVFITDVTLKDGVIGGRTHEDKLFTLSDLRLVQGATNSYTGTSYERNGTTTTVDDSFVSTVKTVSSNGYRKTISTTTFSPVTVTLTVRNNTNDAYRYYFQEVKKSTEVYSNELIEYSASISSYAPSDTQKDGSFVDEETMKIDVTFYLSEDNTYAVTNGAFSNVLEEAALSVVYGMTEADIEDAVVSNVTDSFEKILNDDTLYSDLTTAIMDNFDGNPNRFWTGTYIGNVDGSTNEDTGIIKELFGTDKITQIIGDTEQTVTLIIKWENIDGNESTGTDYTLTNSSGDSMTYKGCEMTLYMTTENLIEDWTYNTYAETVYATVYTCSKMTDGEGNTVYSDWYQFGDVYSGKAQVVGYAGGEINGSFNTGEWYSTDTYYGLRSGSKLSSIISAYISTLD